MQYERSGELCRPVIGGEGYEKPGYASPRRRVSDLFSRRESSSGRIVRTRDLERNAPSLDGGGGRTAQLQNGGTMDRYMQAAVAVAHACGASVCDCYAEWKRMSETRDVTELLANRINHPIPEMHALFADALYGMILGEGRSEGAEETTMLECN